MATGVFRPPFPYVVVLNPIRQRGLITITSKAVNKLYVGAKVRSAVYVGTHPTDDFYKGSAHTSVF